MINTYLFQPVSLFSPFFKMQAFMSFFLFKQWCVLLVSEKKKILIFSAPPCLNKVTVPAGEETGFHYDRKNTQLCMCACRSETSHQVVSPRCGVLTVHSADAPANFLLLSIFTLALSPPLSKSHTHTSQYVILRQSNTFSTSSSLSGHSIPWTYITYMD